MAEFITFNGTSSLAHHLYISDEITHKHTGADVEAVEVLGRDGAVLVSNKRLKPIEQVIPFYLRIPVRARKSVTQVASDISEWLYATNWVDFTKSWDPNYLYKAVVLDDFEVTEMLTRFGKLSITFKLHPIKYLKSGQTMQSVPNGGTLFNPTFYDAKPTFELRGTGNVNLRVSNGGWSKEMHFKNVTSGINVNCENLAVTYGNTSAYDKVSSTSFLSLPTGRNIISWDNANFSLRMKPNWGVKI